MQKDVTSITSFSFTDVKRFRCDSLHFLYTIRVNLNIESNECLQTLDKLGL